MTMNFYVVVGLLALLPVCHGLQCYSCVSTNDACKDPFNASGSGVTIFNSTVFQYCTKTSAAYLVTRSGSVACTEVSYTLGTGASCCQKDLCNGASSTVQTPILILLSMAAAIWQFY